MGRLPSLIVLVVLTIAAFCSSAAALPDAAVAGIDISARDIRGGDAVPVAVRITNRGDATLPPVPVTLSIDDAPYAQWRLPEALPPGASATWDLTWSAERGSHVIVTAVDPFNDVIESNEADNTGFISLGVGGTPEPSPWPVGLAGLTAFILGAAVAFAIQRRRRALQPARYARRTTEPPTPAAPPSGRSAPP